MTVRDKLSEALQRVPMTTLQLSGEVGIPQGEVGKHLEHLARSLPHRGLALEVEPARCLKCEFIFGDRARFKRPSRCPECRSERIQPARFSVHET
ncbi:MAG: transcriptional regulator [Myxococcota bacterium]